MCRNVKPKEAYNLIRNQKAVVLDIRTPGEAAQSHIPGASHIPMNFLPREAGRLPRDRNILLYCRSGSRSASACSYLRSRGFSNIGHIQGGILSWMRDGLPVSGGQQRNPSQPQWGRSVI